MRLCIDYRLPPRPSQLLRAHEEVGKGPANLPADRQESAPKACGQPATSFTPRGFVDRSTWQPATSPAYRAIPHEYTVKAKTAFDPWFDLMVIHIRRHGRKRRWGKRTFTYLGLDGWRYWTMEATPSETTLINRARNRR